MKTQTRIENALFEAQEQYKYIKSYDTPIEKLIRYPERIKILTWILSDLDDDLDY